MQISTFASIECPNNSTLEVLEESLLPWFQQGEGTNCLKEQYRGRPCACGNLLADYKKLLPENDNSLNNMKELIKEENQKVILEAFRKKLLGIMDMGTRADIMMRQNRLESMDMYRTNKCSTRVVFENIERIKKDRRCARKMPNRIAQMIGSDAKNPNLEGMLNELKGKLNNVSALENFEGSEGSARRAYLYQESVSLSNRGALIGLGVAEDLDLDARTWLQTMERAPSFSNYIERPVSEQIISNLNQRFDSENSNPLIASLVAYQDLDLDEGLRKMRNEVLTEIRGIYNEVEQGNVERFNELSKQYPDLGPREVIAKAFPIAQNEYLNRLQDYMKGRKFIDLSLAIANSKCYEMLKPKNLTALFCEDISEVGFDTGLKVTSPRVFEQIPEEERMTLAAANFDLYCGGNTAQEAARSLVNEQLRSTSLSLDKSLNPSLTTTTYAEKLFNGDESDVDDYSENVLAIVNRNLSEDSELDQEKFIADIAHTYAERCMQEETCEFSTTQEAEEYIKSSLTEGLLPHDVFYKVSNDDYKHLQFAINILDEEKANEPDRTTALGIITNQYEQPEMGLMTNWITGANEEDRERGEIIHNEIIAAAEEGREVNQDIITQNAYIPRDLETGEIIAGALPVTGTNRDFTPLTNSLTVTPPVTTDEPDRVSGEDRTARERDIEDTAPPAQNDVVTERVEQPVRSEIIQNRDTQDIVVTNTVKLPTGSTDRPTFVNDNGNLRDVIDNTMAQRRERIEQLENEIHRDRRLLDGANSSEIARIRSQIYDKEMERRRLVNAQSGVSYPRQIAANYPVNRASPHADFGQENRFPSDEQEGERQVTSDGEKIIDPQSSSANSEKDQGIGSASTRGPASIGGNSLKIAGFEKKSLNDCYAPNLHYIYPCFIHIDVLKNIEMVDDLDSKEGQKAIESPRTLVHDFGLEGKMFATVQELDEKTIDGEEQVKITSYDWTPPSPDLYTKMDDEEYRNSVIQEIYHNRWNTFYLKKEAAKTGIYKEQIVTVKDFNKLITDRDTEMIVEPTANHVITNVTRMNLNSREENKEKIDKLYETETIGK